MDYTKFCDDIWDQLTALNISDDGNVSPLLTKLSNLDAFLAPAQVSGITRVQWIDSLAIAGSLVQGGFAWSNSVAVNKAGQRWIKIAADHLDGASTTKISKEVFQSICNSRVRPYFTSTSVPKPQFVLESEDSKVDTRIMDGKKEWSAQFQCVATFIWAFEHLQDEDLIATISYILPVPLDLVDYHHIRAKVHGTKLVLRLLSRMDREFLRKSGIVGILEKSVIDSLIFKSEADKGASVQLLNLSFAAAVKVTQTLYPQMDDPKYTAAWWKLAERIVRNSVHVSDNVAANTVLCKWIKPVCVALGLAVARYLRPLLGVVLKNLQVAVYLTPEVLDLHLISVEQLVLLMDACPPRVEAHSKEILAGLVLSWAMAGKKQSAMTEGVDKLKGIITTALRKLQEHGSANIKTEIQHVINARPDTFGGLQAALI